MNTNEPGARLCVILDGRQIGWADIVSMDLGVTVPVSQTVTTGFAITGRLEPKPKKPPETVAPAVNVFDPHRLIRNAIRGRRRRAAGRWDGRGDPNGVRAIKAERAAARHAELTDLLLHDHRAPACNPEITRAALGLPVALDALFEERRHLIDTIGTRKFG